MKLELLDLLSKAAGIGGICVGIFFIIISKTLKVQFLKLFPVKTAAFMVILTVTLTWSVALLGLLVWINSDMKTYNAVTGEAGDAFRLNAESRLESKTTLYADPSSPDDKKKKFDNETKIGIKSPYKSTNFMKSRTEVETEKKETENEMNQKTKALSMASSISISFLNATFTITFVLFLVWVLFIGSCFFYYKHFVFEIKR